MVSYAGYTTVEMQQTIRDLSDDNTRLKVINADLLAALEAVTEPMTWEDVRFTENSAALPDRGYIGFNVPGERLFQGHADKWWAAMRNARELVAKGIKE